MSESKPRSPHDRLIKDPAVWEQVRKSPHLSKLADDFLEWDHEADTLQKRYQRCLLIIVVCSYIFLLSFELFAHWMKENPWVLLCGIASLLIAIRAYHSGAREIQEEYLLARASSEARRIGFFLRMAGSRTNLCDLIPGIYVRRVQHLATDLNTVYASLPEPTGEETFGQPTIEKEWFEGQRSYLLNAIEKHTKKGVVLLRTSRIAYWIAVVLAVGLAVVALGHHYHWFEVEEQIREALLTICPACLVTAAVAEFYSSKRGFAAHAERYRHARMIYPKPGDSAPSVFDSEKTGDEALQEMLAWYLTSSEREVDLLS